MDFTAKEIEQMAAGMNSFAAEPPITQEETEDALLDQVRRIVKMADGDENQLVARYAADSKSLVYVGRELAHYAAEVGSSELWIEFRMYPALKAKYAHDGRFAEYWRVTLANPQDVENYRDVIVDETL